MFLSSCHQPEDYYLNDQWQSLKVRNNTGFVLAFKLKTNRGQLLYSNIDPFGYILPGEMLNISFQRHNPSVHFDRSDDQLRIYYTPAPSSNIPFNAFWTTHPWPPEMCRIGLGEMHEEEPPGINAVPEQFEEVHGALAEDNGDADNH